VNNKNKKSAFEQLSESPGGHEPNFDESGNRRQLGVYMLENPQTPEAASERLAISQRLCLHNSRVCSKYGQKAKADTWTLLAQTIESIFTFEMDDTAGWAGGALTDGIVEQILRWYEVQGDYQMLTTIVCVLTFGRDRRNPTSSSAGRYQLLPKFDERRYDNYIHHYGALLYAWGVLTVHAEVSKRLAYDMTISRDVNSKSCKLVVSNSGEVAPAVSFAPLCGSCMEPVTNGCGVCPKCKEYVFSCSICQQAVRGCSTWCPLCGHGKCNQLSRYFHCSIAAHSKNLFLSLTFQVGM